MANYEENTSMQGSDAVVGDFLVKQAYPNFEAWVNALARNGNEAAANFLRLWHGDQQPPSKDTEETAWLNQVAKDIKASSYWQQLCKNILSPLPGTYLTLAYDALRRIYALSFLHEDFAKKIAVEIDRLREAHGKLEGAVCVGAAERDKRISTLTERFDKFVSEARPKMLDTAKSAEKLWTVISAEGRERDTRIANVEARVENLAKRSAEDATRAMTDNHTRGMQADDLAARVTELEIKLRLKDMLFPRATPMAPPIPPTENPLTKPPFSPKCEPRTANTDAETKPGARIDWNY